MLLTDDNIQLSLLLQFIYLWLLAFRFRRNAAAVTGSRTRDLVTAFVYEPLRHAVSHLKGIRLAVCVNSTNFDEKSLCYNENG